MLTRITRKKTKDQKQMFSLLYELGLLLQWQLECGIKLVCLTFIVQSEKVIIEICPEKEFKIQIPSKLEKKSNEMMDQENNLPPAF